MFSYKVIYMKEYSQTQDLSEKMALLFAPAPPLLLPPLPLLPLPLSFFVVLICCPGNVSWSFFKEVGDPV